ncbi:MAG: DEAD/DEAH box helicase, partial [Armatimonadetes bacterium]|nr:DEAD/DEAH box helicase [Armatimonadota bacterium]
MNVERFLQDISTRPEYRGQAKEIRVIPGREARYGTLEPPPPPPVSDALKQLGIERLWAHQAEAIEKVRAGRNVVVVTSTASGKSLCYNLPVLEALNADSRTRALYVFPTKALAQDQLKTLNHLRELIADFDFEAGTYDGDTPQSRRRALRERANIILTNPDMLHSGILPNHSRWSHFFGHLRYVVIDELHTYRGIFGSNVALLLRRLRRICRHYGSSPVYICCSATIGNPKEHAEALLGEPVEVISNDGSPAGEKVFVFWNPPMVDRELGLRRSADLEAQWLMTRLIADHRVQVIAFLRARRQAELLYRYVREALLEESPELAEKVRSYRGGYLPHERREIERALFSGELLGVTSTNALELGIDIGSLDVSIIVGYPGSVSSTWQQAGRAGRGTDKSLAVL